MSFSQRLLGLSFVLAFTLAARSLYTLTTFDRKIPWTEAGPTTIQQPSDEPRFAAVFLIAGVNPERPAHRGFLHNVVLAAYMLRESNIDLHVMIRMSAETDQDFLDKQEESLLRRANLRIRYLTKVRDDSFYSAMMEKFILLEYEQYDRILYVDADILPLCNLRYLLVASYTGHLKSNVVIKWMVEPSSGGLFILKPGKKDRLAEIVANQWKRQQKETKFFDEWWGWGQPMYLPWEALKPGQNGMNWTFYGAYADQGLLYHWVLYEQQEVSAISVNKIHHYGSKDGKAYLEEVVGNDLPVCVPPAWKKLSRRVSKGAPYADMIHFAGKNKPWKEEKYEVLPEDPMDAEDSNELWLSLRNKVAQEWNVTFPEIDKSAHSPLGKGPVRKFLQDAHDGIAAGAWRKTRKRPE